MELKKYKLGEIGDVVTGKTPSTLDESNFGGNIPFITPSDITNNAFMLKKAGRTISIKGFESIKANTISGPSVLVGCIGSDMGNVGFVDMKCATNQQINSITNIKEFCNPVYLYYRLSQMKDIFQKMSNSTTTPILSKSEFEKISITLPSLSIQQNIANTLSSLDRKIALNRAINQNLEALITDTTDYMFLSRMDELKKVSIGEIALIKAGGDCPKDYTISPNAINSIPIYSNGTEDEGLYGYTSQEVIDGRRITVAARGTIGYCVRRYGKYVPIIRLLSVCPYDRGADTYLQQIISRMSFKKNGSVQQQLTVPELSIMQIPYPTKEELIKYDEITFPLIRQINQHKEENKALTKQRDELLPLLMNGQVTIE